MLMRVVWDDTVVLRRGGEPVECGHWEQLLRSFPVPSSWLILAEPGLLIFSPKIYQHENIHPLVLRVVYIYKVLIVVSQIGY